MFQDIYNPLAEYRDVFSVRFKEIAESTFAELAAEANIDVKANKETCRNIYADEKNLASVKSRIRRNTTLCVLLWLALVGGGVAVALKYKELDESMLAVIIVAFALVLLILFAGVHPKIKNLKSDRERLGRELKNLNAKAWEQMSPLNRLYDWDVLTRMMVKAVPKLEFDPYFTVQRLVDLQATYGWDDSFNDGRSVLYSHSGLINGNPFVLCRTKMMRMGVKTYTGYKTISWTTSERGNDGQYHTVSHSETLTATVTAPYPEYFEKTRLIYGNTAAPDLVFNRTHSNLASREGSSAYRRARRQLRRKANDLKKSDYAMMTNEEFEVVFDTRDRNNNQQFALLFTPLAQENMVQLLKDNKVGYGDDFDFCKHKMINVIVPQHLQRLSLDLNPEQYRTFDYERGKQDFLALNAEYFRAIYFALAPLLCVPMYQQIRPQEAIYGRDIKTRSAYWEHEALANFWGNDYFKHPDCATDCILKTSRKDNSDGDSLITVTAYGYRKVKRVSHENVWGGDGKLHSVPVYWDEYLDVTGTGHIHIHEDNDFEAGSASQSERIKHISSVLSDADMNVYRRHIASKI